MDTDSDSQQADKVRPSALSFQNICSNLIDIDPFIPQSLLGSSLCLYLGVFPLPPVALSSPHPHQASVETPTG